MFVDQVYIYETYHAGGLQTLSVRDTANSWHLVWTTPNITVIRHSRIFAPDFQVLDYRLRLTYLLIQDNCCTVGKCKCMLFVPSAGIELWQP